MIVPSTPPSAIMQFKSLVLFATVASVAARLTGQKATRLTQAHNSTSRLDINQKVYIENAPVLGDGAGEALLGICTNFAPAHVDHSGGAPFVSSAI